MAHIMLPWKSAMTNATRSAVFGIPDDVRLLQRKHGDDCHEIGYGFYARFRNIHPPTISAMEWDDNFQRTMHLVDKFNDRASREVMHDHLCRKKPEVVASESAVSGPAMPASAESDSASSDSIDDVSFARLDATCNAIEVFTVCATRSAMELWLMTHYPDIMKEMNPQSVFRFVAGFEMAHRASADQEEDEE